MSEVEEKYTKYLNDHGVLPRLLEILEQLLSVDPLPTDPLMDILHALGCPLIPQAQMKALERKVTRAQDELRYLRRVLIDLGRQDELYDSDTDENEYIGQVGELGAAPLFSPNFTNDEEYCSPTQSPAPSSPYVLEDSIAISTEQSQLHYDDDQPCSSHKLRCNVQQL